MSNRFKISLLLILFFSGASVLWLVGSMLTAPAPMHVGDSRPELKAENVSFLSGSGETIRGWYVPGVQNAGAVLLLHGIRSNRTSMAPRAHYFSSQGYSVLLIDLQSHGESSGNGMTFGWKESKDVDSAIEYLRLRLPDEKIGVIGSSLGGAALLLSRSKSIADALVTESVYPTIEKAVENRLEVRLGLLGKYLSPLLLWQLPLRLGIYTSELRPLDRVKDSHPPLLIISGTVDRNTTIEESMELFAAASEPKNSWWVLGAAHVDLYEYDRQEYQKRVGDFFLSYLRH